MAKRYVFPILLICFGVSSSLFYFFWIRPIAVEAYHGTAPAWFNGLVDAIYPRFIVEKERFDLSFFLRKADQILIRLNVVLVAFAVFVSVAQEEGFRQAFHRLTNVRKDRLSLKLLLLVFYTGCLSYTSVWHEDLVTISHLRPFFKPIPFYELLQLHTLPSLEVMHVVFFLMMLSGILIILGKVPFTASIIHTFCFLFLQGLFYCFEKTDHRFATLTIGVVIMPFLTYLQSNAPKDRTFNAWPVQLIRLGVAMAYLLAGLEKLFTSGFGWASAETFRNYIYLHQVPFGMKLAASGFWAHVVPAMGLAFQLGFCLILFLPRYRLFFMLAGVGFHVGTVLLFGIGDYLTPWIFMYMFFIDWRWLRHRAKYAWRGNQFRGNGN